jgi:DNA-binding beta-propeller fold protein YncE
MIRLRFLTSALVFATLLFTRSCDQSPPIPKWAGTLEFGSIANESAAGVALSPSGNLYVAGSTYGGLFGNINQGWQDAFLVKYNQGGTLRWARQFGTNSSDLTTAVAADANENAYITGTTGLDPFLMKFNPDGVKQWTAQSGASAIGVAVDSEGNAYITGSTARALDGNLYAGASDVFLMKYDPSGIKLSFFSQKR